MEKLKYKDIPAVRNTQLKAQTYRCALCDDVIHGDAVLDHDHKTGLVRKVLHRGCNALLGKIENNMLRNKVTLERLTGISQRLIGYITDTHTDLTHPTFKTKEEQNESTARKRIKNRKKQKEAKTAQA
jgi:MinD superfamily P-loop ATPase